MRLRRPSHRPAHGQAQALSAYWDEVARRAPAEPVPPAGLDRNLAATVRHLSALPGDAVPDPRFADQLLDRIVAPSQERTAMPTASPAPLGLMPAVPFSPATNGVGRGGRWSAGLAVAAVALVALLGAWAVTLRDDDPPGHRDTTALAAAGTPLPTVPPGGSATTTTGAPVVVAQGQLDLFSGVVDLAGPDAPVELWLVDLTAGDTVVIPASAYPILAMPLWDLIEESTTGTIVGAGQAFTVATGAEARVTAQERQTNRLLVASFGGRLLFTSADGGVAPARHLGELTVDQSFDLGLLEVRQRTSGRAGDGPIDTGRGGVAVILAEESPTAVDVLAGDAILRRAAAGGGLAEGELRIGAGDRAAPTYLGAGDVLTITGGAAFAFRSPTETGSPVVAVTIRFDSARLDQVRHERAGEATPMPTATPLADEGCNVTPYTADELRSLVATPASGPLPSIGFTLADGVPADTRTAAEIGAAADLLAVCSRTNDPLRYTRLYSADGLRFVYSVNNLEDDLQLEVPPAERPGHIDVTVQDVRVHPDGRVSAVVDLDGEVAYVVWVKRDGAYLVELFNDAIFSGPPADGARCDTAPLRPEELAGIAPEPLVPATPAGDRGLDISAPSEGPPTVAPGALGADVASASVGRIFDCLSTRDPARIVPLATDAFRAQ